MLLGRLHIGYFNLDEMEETFLEALTMMKGKCIYSLKHTYTPPLLPHTLHKTTSTRRDRSHDTHNCTYNYTQPSNLM